MKIVAQKPLYDRSHLIILPLLVYVSSYSNMPYSDLGDNFILFSGYKMKTCTNTPSCNARNNFTFAVLFAACFIAHFYILSKGSDLIWQPITIIYSQEIQMLNFNVNSPLTRSTSMRSGLIWPVFLGLLPKPCSYGTEFHKSDCIHFTQCCKHKLPLCHITLSSVCSSDFSQICWS